MMRILACILALAAVATQASAQMITSDQRPSTTRVPEQTGCFEIFLSPRQARETYLLNACTGETWQRIQGIERGGWQAIPREDNADNEETLSLIKHFRIVSSGLTARDTFLLNTLNGATWQLYEGADETLFWGTMARTEP